MERAVGISCWVWWQVSSPSVLVLVFVSLPAMFLGINSIYQSLIIIHCSINTDIIMTLKLVSLPLWIRIFAIAHR